MTLLPDLEDFLLRHRPHGSLTADATEPAWNGYLLTVACPCGMVFERWVTPEEAGRLFASARSRLRRETHRPTNDASACLHSSVVRAVLIRTTLAICWALKGLARLVSRKA